MWGVGFATVDLRIRKLLKRFVATPMKRTHFLAAMICSRLMFTVPEVVIILLCSRYFFGVGIQGNVWVFGLLILAGAVQFAGIGLLVASRASTVETVSGLMNAVMMPMWIGSGIGRRQKIDLKSKRRGLTPRNNPLLKQQAACTGLGRRVRWYRLLIRLRLLFRFLCVALR